MHYENINKLIIALVIFNSTSAWLQDKALLLLVVTSQLVPSPFFPITISKGCFEINNNNILTSKVRAYLGKHALHNSHYYDIE